ncbi:hypothetical protein [Phaeacidiphilus oryzae]|uniref:hypothetical protein n=1 Tax=Phaeacidiphilus oryzae TaxID=348818 RepID=UPI00056B9B56|nr:hypothetical protein [Phaeacidiphilus oryzae]
MSTPSAPRTPDEVGVLYLALSTARARQVKYDTDFLVSRGVPVDLLVSAGDDWSAHGIDRRVRLRSHQEALSAAGLPPRTREAVRLARGAARRVPLAPARTRALRAVNGAARRAELLAAERQERRRRTGLAVTLAGSPPAAPRLAVIGGAASLPLAHRLADAYPGLEMTFELDWSHPYFADLPVVDSTVAATAGSAGGASR